MADRTRDPLDGSGALGSFVAPSDAPSKAESAAEMIGRMCHDSPVGSLIGTKVALRLRVGVAIGTLNEALRLLQARGIITVKPGPGGGIFVAEQSPMARLGNAVLNLDTDQRTIAEAVRIRKALEMLIVEDAIHHAGREEVAAMRESLGMMSTAVVEDDGMAFLHADWHLHSRILESSPSSILHSLYSSLLDLLKAHTVSIAPVEGRSIREFHTDRYMIHAALVEAIAARDLERAEQLVAQHNAGLSSPANPSRRKPGSTDQALSV